MCLKSCLNCGVEYKIDEKDIDFYNKISPKINGEKIIIPVPKLCPECRKQRRLSFLNFSSLHKRKCNSCGENIISRFSEKSGIKNYCNKCWSSDSWNQLEFGQEIDWGKSFFGQFGEMLKNTVFQNLIGSSSNVENNAIYTNHTSEIKDSYLVFEANNVQDSYYGMNIKNSKFVVDSMCIGNSEYVYKSTDSHYLYKTSFAKNSHYCRFSYFLNNCINCEYCIGCTNLEGKKYYIFNEKSTEEEYNKLASKFGSNLFITEFMNKFNLFSSENLIISDNIVRSENCTGKNISDSNNAIDCTDALGIEDSRFCASVNYSRDLYDISSYGEESYLMLDSVSVGRYSNNILFSSVVGKSENLIYCIDVKKSKNCFLCANLEDKEYCILNKQYSKEDYELLLPKIIKKMNLDGEWGEFLPINISPFSYNETQAQKIFPLSKDEIIQKGYSFFEESINTNYMEKIIDSEQLPDNISDIPDDIINRAIKCSRNGKPFRILFKELEFYRKMNIPIPNLHPEERQIDNINFRS